MITSISSPPPISSSFFLIITRVRKKQFEKIRGLRGNLQPLVHNDECEFMHCNFSTT